MYRMLYAFRQYVFRLYEKSNLFFHTYTIISKTVPLIKELLDQVLIPKYFAYVKSFAANSYITFVWAIGLKASSHLQKSFSFFFFYLLGCILASVITAARVFFLGLLFLF